MRMMGIAKYVLISLKQMMKSTDFHATIYFIVSVLNHGLVIRTLVLSVE